MARLASKTAGKCIVTTVLNIQKLGIKESGWIETSIATLGPCLEHIDKCQFGAVLAPVSNIAASP